MVIRIAMWSGPRNISTAMMRAWGSRADTSVVDEPFYAAYLVSTGLDHPMREQVIASQSTDWQEIARQCAGDDGRHVDAGVNGGGSGEAGPRVASSADVRLDTTSPSDAGPREGRPGASRPDKGRPDDVASGDFGRGDAGPEDGAPDDTGPEDAGPDGAGPDGAGLGGAALEDGGPEAHRHGGGAQGSAAPAHRQTTTGAGNPPKIIYQKHMAQHMIEGAPLGWMAHLRHAFLIRPPREVVASFSAKWEGVRAEDLGFARQVELFDQVRELTGRTPPVIEARDVLENPEAMLSTLCRALEVPFDPAMLRWERGPRETDGIWGAHWYEAVNNSTGFAPPPPPPAGELPSELQRIAEECEPHYRRLAEFRLKPDRVAAG